MICDIFIAFYPKIAAKLQNFLHICKFFSTFAVRKEKNTMESIQNFFGTVDIWQVLSSFIFLIAIIDPFGNIPVTMAIEERGVKISAWRVCLASLIILLAFVFYILMNSVLFLICRNKQ